VTGGDTHHYTNWEVGLTLLFLKLHSAVDGG